MEKSQGHAGCDKLLGHGRGGGGGKAGKEDDDSYMDCREGALKGTEKSQEAIGGGKSLGRVGSEVCRGKSGTRRK